MCFRPTKLTEQQQIVFPFPSAFHFEGVPHYRCFVSSPPRPIPTHTVWPGTIIMASRSPETHTAVTVQEAPVPPSQQQRFKTVLINGKTRVTLPSGPDSKFGAVEFRRQLRSRLDIASDITDVAGNPITDVAVARLCDGDTVWIAAYEDGSYVYSIQVATRPQPNVHSQR